MSTPDTPPPSYWVAVNMRAYRKAAGLSQQELADKIGWLKSVVCSTEANGAGAKRARKIGIDDVVRIAGVLGVTIEDLIRPIPPCETCGDAPPEGFTCNTCGRGAQ